MQLDTLMNRILNDGVTATFLNEYMQLVILCCRKRLLLRSEM